MNTRPDLGQPAGPPALAAEEILESITDGFFAVDRNWRVTYVNREAERMIEKPRSELLGKDLWAIFPEASDSIFRRQYVRAFKTGQPVHFEEFYSPLQRWFDVRAYPADNHLTVYVHDNTERRRSEEALKISRERFDLVL